ncbi:MAG: hypothetical protein KatS3mg040_0372 [Candidatus Kapaibacterium sp.]|nr:MAG: hypothetical protein KatS3mg040_0372 [Candidatus Kapabacteria bacterium]
MKTVRLVALLLCAWLALCSSRAASNDQGQFLIGAAASGGVNLHDASFGSFPGVHSCCSSFGTQWTPTVGIAGIVEHDGHGLASIPIALQLRIGLTQLGGTLTRDEFIGNVIVGDSLVRGTSRHQLEATLWAVSAEPLLRFLLPTHPAFSFDVGARFDWIVVARFAQQEQLTNPAAGVYFETRNRTRNAASGSIPTAAQFGAALSAGMSYSIPLTSRWTLRPELRGSLGITRLADVPWHIHRIVAGIAFLHRPESIQPTVAPPAPIVEPPPPPLAFDVETRVLGIHRRSVDTSIVELPARRIERRSMVLPVVFFAPQSAALDSAAEQQIALVAHAAQRSSAPIHLAPRTAPDEPDSLRLLRFRAVAERLRAFGVRVAPSPIEAPQPAQAPLAITDELRAVWIKTSGPLVLRESFLVPTSQPSVEVVLRPVVHSSAGPVRFDLTVAQDGRQTLHTESAPAVMRFELSPAQLLAGTPTAYRWTVVAMDTAGQTQQRSGNGIVRPEFIERDTALEELEPGSAVLLGRCAFDAATFEEFDTTLAAFVRRAARAGKTVVLIGSTDAIGSDSYNRALARRRAEAALERLGLSPQAVQIEVQIGGPHERTLYQRVARRGVLVRIEER